MAGSARGNKDSRFAQPGQGEAPLPCVVLGVIGQVASRRHFKGY